MNNNSKSKNIFFLVLLILFSQDIYSNDYHFCECSTGADADCIAGNDVSGDGGINNPWQSYEKARNTFAILNAGDSIKFCNGGYWDINGAGERWTNSNCLADSVCQVGNYNPIWSSGDESLPTLERLDNQDMFALEDGGNANHEEGYHFSNLIIKGSSLARGFFLYNDIDDVTIDNVTISNFLTGISVAESNTCDNNDLLCDGLNDRIVLSNSTVINNHEQGWIGSSNGSKILNNYFANNGNIAMFDHNIYLATHTHVDDMQVIGNQLYHSALDANNICQGV